MGDPSPTYAGSELSSEFSTLKSSEPTEPASCPAPSLVLDGSNAAHENPRSILKPRRGILKEVRFSPDAVARKKKRPCRPRRTKRKRPLRAKKRRLPRTYAETKLGIRAREPHRCSVEVPRMKLILAKYEKIELDKYNDHFAGAPPTKLVRANRAPKRKRLKRKLRKRSLSDELSSDPGRGPKPSRLRVWSRNLS